MRKYLAIWPLWYMAPSCGECRNFSLTCKLAWVHDVFLFNLFFVLFCFFPFFLTSSSLAHYLVTRCFFDKKLCYYSLTWNFAKKRAHQSDEFRSLLIHPVPPWSHPLLPVGGDTCWERISTERIPARQRHHLTSWTTSLEGRKEKGQAPSVQVCGAPVFSALTFSIGFPPTREWKMNSSGECCSFLLGWNRFEI